MYKKILFAINYNFFIRTVNFVLRLVVLNFLRIFSLNLFLIYNQKYLNTIMSA